MSVDAYLNEVGALDPGRVQESATRSVAQSFPLGTTATDSITPDDDLWMYDLFIRENSYAGRVVTVEDALRYGPVYAAVYALSMDIGSLPLRTYRQISDDHSDIATNHPYYRLLNLRPNPEETAINAWSRCVAHLKGWGNAFIGKDMVGNRVVNLWPIHPERVRVTRRNGQRVYLVRSARGAAVTEYTAAEIIHIKDLSVDGNLGMSPIQQAREAVGRGLAMDEYTNRFYSNSAVPRGALSSEQKIDDTTAKRLRATWEKVYKGGRNAHRVAVLGSGLKFQDISPPMKDLEFVSQMEFGVTEIARIFNMPASRINGTLKDGLTYKTVEGDNLRYVSYSLRPIFATLEQALGADADLFPDPTFFPNFYPDALLRGTTQERYAAWATAPHLLIDEIRAKDGLPALPDAKGQVLAKSVGPPKLPQDPNANNEEGQPNADDPTGGSA